MANPGGVSADTEIRPLTHSEFEQIRLLAHEKFGLDLRQGKEELVSARLRKKVRQSHFQTFQAYYDHVRRDPTGEALEDMIDALTTNYTGFLREPPHFELLRNVIAPDLAGRTGTQIWSAACATGEEPYSIAMCLVETLGPNVASRIRILATDISNHALDTARNATYPAERFEGFPKSWLQRYWLRGSERWQGWFRLKPAVRQMVEFRRVNLIKPLVNIPKVFVIFCRNVMIYFDKDTQATLVRELASCLEPGGYLLTGHSESLVGGAHALRYVQPAVYRKPEEAHRGASLVKEGKCAR